MLDLKLIREDPLLIKRDLEKRGAGDKASCVDDLLEYDKIRRKLLIEINDLRHRRNVITTEIAEMRKEGKDVTAKMREAKAIPVKIKKLEEQIREHDEKVNYILLRLPNVMHESVPIGKDENDNVVLRTWGTRPEFDFKAKDHIDIGLALDLINIERAAKTSGARFYYLKNEAVMLEFAIVQFVLDLLVKEKFTPVIPPALVKKEAMCGAGFLPLGEEDIYKIKNEDLCLAGTSEIPLAAMHMNEILDENTLPLYYTGFSTCFRTEAGAHGRDTKGIFRVHQFDKVEMFKFTTPETSWEEHEKLIATAEKIYQKLGFHYRVVNICSGELGVTAAKKYDIEVWLPGQGKYREVVSCSNCTDYQARRLNVRCRKKSSEKPRFVHTLNSTAVAIGRALVAIFENFQQEDGSVRIPEALSQYMGEVELIKRR